MEELSTAFSAHNWLLSAAVSPAKFRVNDGYDVARIAKYLDFINVMTYDLHGSWDKAADHHAPLHKREHDDWDPLTTVNLSLCICVNISKRKKISSQMQKYFWPN